MPVAVADAAPVHATADATPTAAHQGAFTVLLLGSDNDSKFHGDHVLTQSMILVRFNPSTKQVTMLSIPRDLWVPLSTGGTGKIDGAYSYGGAGAAIATVENNFGVHIDDYIWIGLLGLVNVIDAIGGIDVVTSTPVFDDYYPLDINSSGPVRLPASGGAGRASAPGWHPRAAVRAVPPQRPAERLRTLAAAAAGAAGDPAKAKQISPEDVPALAQRDRGRDQDEHVPVAIATLLPLAGEHRQPGRIQQIVLLPPYTHGGAPGGSLYAGLGRDPAAGAPVLPVISRVVLAVGLAVLMVVSACRSYVYLGSRQSKVAAPPSSRPPRSPRPQRVHLPGTLYPHPGGSDLQPQRGAVPPADAGGRLDAAGAIPRTATCSSSSAAPSTRTSTI